MATTIVDFTAFPQALAVSGAQITALSDGKWRATYTFTLASSNAAWGGGGFFALTACNDLGGLWVYDDSGTRKIALFEDASGSPLIVEAAVTWGAGAAVTVIVDNIANTLTISGATTGNGTFAFTGSTTGNAFTTSPLGGGAYGGGGFTWSGSMTDIDDANDAIAGTGTPTIAAVTAVGAGTLAIAGTSTATVPAVTSAGTGALAIAGTGSPTISAPTSTGAGAVAIAGTGAPAVPDVTSAGSGTIGGGGIAGTGSPTVAAVTAAGTGTLAIGGTSSATIPAVTSAGAGAVSIAGTGTPVVPAVTSAGAGAVAIAGTGTPTIAAVTSIGSGSENETVSWGSFDGQRVLYGTAAGTVTTESLTTVNGSTFVIVTGGNLGDLVDPPTDSKSNTYTQLGAAEEFDRWADYGLALWICVDGIGGSGHTFSQEYGQTLGFDEMTIAAAEIRNGHHIQGFTIAQALTGSPLVFGAVTTTAAAILAAFFCGDAPTGATTTVSLSNSYTVDDTDTLPDHPNGYVPIAIAHADKPTAGSHGTTATETPDQGAIMIQVALQVAEVRTGTGTPTIPAATSVGAGTLTSAGQANITIAPVTSAGAGAVAIAGTGTPTIPSVTSVGSGHVALAGTGSPTMPAVASTGSGALPIAGSGGGSVGVIAASGTGALPVAGTGSPAVPAIGAAASGAIPIAGAGSPTIPPVTSSGAGTNTSGPLGTGTPVVGDVGATGTGTLPVAGSGAATVGPVTAAAAGTLPIAATGGGTIPAITSTGSGSEGTGAVVPWTREAYILLTPIPYYTIEFTQMGVDMANAEIWYKHETLTWDLFVSRRGEGQDLSIATAIEIQLKAALTDPDPPVAALSLAAGDVVLETQSGTTIGHATVTSSATWLAAVDAGDYWMDVAVVFPGGVRRYRPPVQVQIRDVVNPP